MTMAPSAYVVGMRFLPTDEELLQYYLYRKITGKSLPENIILEADLYGTKNPWQIWEIYSENIVKAGEDEDLYFFTMLKRKNTKAKRVERKVGIGSWMGEDAGKKIMGDGKCIGTKKRLRFENSRTDHDGGWIMHEFSLDHSLLPPGFQNDYVLCRMRKNSDKITKNLNKRKGLWTSPELGLNPKKLQKKTELEKNYTDSENALSIFCNVASVSNEPDQHLQFGGKKEKGVESEKKEEDPYLQILFGEEDIVGPITLEGQKLYVREETFQLENYYNAWVESFLKI